MVIVVTGGSGYVGRRLVPLLLSVGHDVVNIDRQLYSVDPLQHPKLAQIPADIRMIEVMEDILKTKKPEAFVSLADLNMSEVCLLQKRMSKDIREASARNIRMAQEMGVPFCIQVSSTSVIDPTHQPEEDDGKLPCHFIGAYETEILDLNFEKVVGITTLRLPYLYGWSPRMRFDLPLNTCVAVAKGMKFIPKFIDETESFAALHVQDAAVAIKKALDAFAPGIYNVVGQNAVFSDVIGGIRRFISEVETADTDGSTINSVKVSGEKFNKKFGFQPSFNIHDGIREVFSGLQQNPQLNWLDPIYHNSKMVGS